MNHPNIAQIYGIEESGSGRALVMELVVRCRAVGDAGGQRMFNHSTVAHILADVLRAPIDLEELPQKTPRAVRDLLKSCLDRDVKTYLRDIGEARVAIQNLGKKPGVAASAAATGSSSGRLPWIVAAECSP